MKFWVEISSFAVMLVVSVIFGFMGKSVEMGLCIVAGAISVSLVNLDKFKKIKGAGFEAELIEKMQAVVEKETEPFAIEENDISGEDGNPVPDASRVDISTREVIKALLHHEYTWRYLGGIKQDTNLNKSQIKESLQWLLANGYAKQSLGNHGTIWNLTEEGRYLSAVIDFEHVKA